MRTNLIIALVCLFGIVNAQKEIKPTSSFTISGEVKEAKTINVSDILKLKEYPIGDVTITNHLGEKKSEAKGLKGILLKELLQLVEIKTGSPKLLSEYYLVCKATDGYKVVYSWHEIFNSKVGEAVYVVTEKNSIRLDKMDDSILMISPLDFKTGRRYVKSLANIEIKRAD